MREALKVKRRGRLRLLVFSGTGRKEKSCIMPELFAKNPLRYTHSFSFLGKITMVRSPNDTEPQVETFAQTDTSEL